MISVFDLEELLNVLKDFYRRGRGVPMGWNEKEGQYNWFLIYCEMYAGGKYDNNSDEVSADLHACVSRHLFWLRHLLKWRLLFRSLL